MRIFILLLSITILFTSVVQSSSEIHDPYENIRVDIKPELIYQPKIEIPDTLNLKNKSTNIWMSVYVNNEGKVGEAKIDIPCDDSTINEITLKTVMNYEFKPAIKDGIPVWYWVWLKIDIKIKLINKKNTYKIDIDFDYRLPSSNEYIPCDILPELIYDKAPKYPKEAREKNITGTVWVKVLIDKKGNVIKAIIAKSSGNELLDNAALEVAPLFRYKPGIQNGKPIAIWLAYKVNFNLGR